MRDEELNRLQALEQLVRALVRDVEALRAQVGAPRDGTLGQKQLALPLNDAPRSEPAAPAAAADQPSPSPTPSPQPAGAGAGAGAGQSSHRDTDTAAPPSQRPFRPAPARTTWNLEELVGRYGTVALGAAVILAGVGVLISWAIAQGMFGPRTRLLLAAILAAICAGVGLRLRERGSQRFGNVLLALSLALTQLVAWGAGPTLGVVPDVVALGVAAAASAALALLALTHGEETLYTVGVGGALLAPFVTIDADGVLPLLVYGLIVLLAAMWPLRRHAWRLAPALLVIGALVYAGSAMGATRPDAASWMRVAPFAFTLVLAWGALLLAVPAGLVFAFIGVGVAAGNPWSDFGTHGDGLTMLVPLAGAALLTAYAAMRWRPVDGAANLAALALPFTTMWLALLYLPGPLQPWYAIVPALWAAAAVGAAALDQERRELHALVASSAGVIAIGIAADGLTQSLALLVYALLVLRLSAALTIRLPALPSLLALGYVVFEAFVALSEIGYGVPFRSQHTIVAAASVLALVALTRIHRGEVTLERAAQVAAVIVAFLWLRLELASAFGSDAATFSLIIYYATTGVIALAVGRWRGIAPARHAGLLVACYAGLKALWEASDLEPIGLRFGAFMLVGVFLLAVAYRYWPKREALPPVDAVT